MITFRPFNFDSESDCQIQAKWESDPSIRHLFCFYPDEASAFAPVTAEDIARQGQGGRIPNRWMILSNDKPVGEMGFSMDDELLVTKSPQTAWAGIVVGEASARGRGVGEAAMRYLEEQVAKSGAQKIELGVFEFNETAIRFYNKLGYREIARLPDFAYWNGKRWTDIRMLKDLTALKPPL